MKPKTSTRIHHGPYTISSTDSAPTPVEEHPIFYLSSTVLTWSLWLIYFLYQIYYTHHTPLPSWKILTILLSEFCLSFQELVLAINLIFALCCASDTSPRPSYFLEGNAVPTIDILITCCGEPIDIILDTIAATLTLDYPSSHFRVFLLDDGHDIQLKTALRVLSKEQDEKDGPKVHYLSRTVPEGQKSHFKAGNLQFGIETSKQMGSSDFIAALDADMIPSRDWLRRIVPHLILDGKLALACPPQAFYNTPPTDPLGQASEFHLFFTIYEPLNDRLNAAMCTGSGYILSRSALESIGGWPLVDTGEDFMCSARLSDAGWKVGFVREGVQRGLAPGSMRGYLKQRMRWVDSGIVVHKYFNFYLPGSSRTSGMTLAQRAIGILQALREYAPMTNVLALLLLPLAMYPQSKLTSYRELTGSKEEQEARSWLWVLFLASIIARKVHSFLLHKHVGMRRTLNFQSLDIWCAPYTASRCLASLLPSSASCSLKFESSGSITSHLNERSALHRAPLHTRILTPFISIYTMYILYASLPLILHIYPNLTTNTNLTTTLATLPLLPGPTLKLLDAISKTSVPIWYMMFPPTVPEREGMMEGDEFGVRRPRVGDGDEEGKGGHWEWFSVVEGVGLGLVWLCW